MYTKMEILLISYPVRVSGLEAWLATSFKIYTNLGLKPLTYFEIIHVYFSLKNHSHVKLQTCLQITNYTLQRLRFSSIRTEKHVNVILTSYEGRAVIKLFSRN